MVKERDDIHMLAAGHAAGALDPEDEQLFARHLAVCEPCRSDLASLENAAAALAVAVEPVAPPAELRERLLEHVREERAKVTPLRARRSAAAFAYGAAAVAACLAVAFGVWAASLSRSLDRERSARHAQERALALLAEPGSREIALSGADGVLVRQRSGTAALIVSALPRAPSGRTYEAWVVRGAVPPVPAGVFHGGGRPTVFVLERPVVDVARVLVTLERAGGAKAPTGKPLFGAKVSQA